jgi:hypothetical protein
VQADSDKAALEYDPATGHESTEEETGDAPLAGEGTAAVEQSVETAESGDDYGAGGADFDPSGAT